MTNPDDFAYEMYLAEREDARVAALEDAAVYTWAHVGTLNVWLDRLAAETDDSPSSVMARDAAVNINWHLDEALRHTWFGASARSSVAAPPSDL
jgi:hypothetical protein